MDEKDEGLEFILGFMESNTGWRRPIPPDERVVRIKKFKDEIAFHEASHFVFSVLFLRYFPPGVFSPINFITCCAKKVNEQGHHNVVNGFAPMNIPEYKLWAEEGKEPSGFIEFYNSDRRRLAAIILVFIAGYSSYQVFVKYKEHYIFSNVKFNVPQTGVCTITYLDKYNAIGSDADDFVKIDRKLRTYYLDSLRSGKSKVDAISNFTEAAQALMRQKAINDSIRMVKKILLKHECNKIEGWELDCLVQMVSKFTNKIELNDILDRLKDKIE